MLIELADDLVDDHSEQELSGLEVICLARRFGHHLLIGSDRVFRELGQYSDISKSARAMLRVAGNKQRQKRGLMETTNCRLKVSRVAAPFAEEVHGITVINVRLADVCDLRTLAPAVVLGESDIDARLGRQMARYYIVKQNSQIAPSVKLMGELCGGGGNATSVTFAMHRDAPRLCVCLADSDKRAPNDKFGSTAKRILNEVDPEKPWAAVIVLSCREAENTLPVRIVERVVSTEAGSHVVAFERLGGSEFGRAVRDYCDLKDGATFEWVLSLDLEAGPVAEHWRGGLSWIEGLPSVKNNCIELRRCLGGGKCECWVTPKLGKGILDRCVKEMERMTRQKVAESVCDPIEQHWRCVGKSVFSWICGTEPVRT